MMEPYFYCHYCMKKIKARDDHKYKIATIFDFKIVSCVNERCLENYEKKKKEYEILKKKIRTEEIIEKTAIRMIDDLITKIEKLNDTAEMEMDAFEDYIDPYKNMFKEEEDED